MDDTNQNDPTGSTDDSAQTDGDTTPVVETPAEEGESTPEPTVGGDAPAEGGADEAPAEGGADAPAADDSTDQAAA